MTHHNGRHNLTAGPVCNLGSSNYIPSLAEFSTKWHCQVGKLPARLLSPMPYLQPLSTRANSAFIQGASDRGSCMPCMGAAQRTEHCSVRDQG